MKKFILSTISIFTLFATMLFSACMAELKKNDTKTQYEHLTTNSTIGDLLNHPAFEGFAEQMLPFDNHSYNKNMMLNNISSLMVYHSHINQENLVAAINRLIDDVNDDKQIFYDFYTDEEKATDPSKNDTGLFFYCGEIGKPFAVQCAGGEQIATEDLAAAISFIIKNANELGVSPTNYSIWGGSAGARMAANIGSYGTGAWGGKIDSRPTVVVMAYTGRSDYTENDPPTFVVVGENDGIANPRTMERRINALKAIGIDTEFHEYPNLEHGFGIGLGTSAEGWVDDAVEFWNKHIK